jgi:hypothetical protein
MHVYACHIHSVHTHAVRPTLHKFMYSQAMHAHSEHSTFNVSINNDMPQLLLY